MPGVFAPYPTSDRPSCTAVQEEGRDEEEVILYGYFENKQKNIENCCGSAGIGKGEIPPSYGKQSYISLRNSPEECLDRSNWGKKHNEYVYYRMRIPKHSYKWMYRQKYFKELGKSDSGKQWVPACLFMMTCLSEDKNSECLKMISGAEKHV